MAVKYRLEIKDISEGVDWKVDILEDGFAGTITNLVGGADPIKFNWENLSDDVFSPIKESKLTLTIVTNSDFVLQDLYSVDDFHFKVIAYENTVIKWTGFVSTGNYSEPYEQTPFPITITCDDGLKQLKNILYDNAGTYYNGRRLDSQIILDILGKLGVTGFTEFVNIYEASMDSTINDSPLDQTKPDVDVFKDKYCDEVLSETLKKYNAIIIHEHHTVAGFHYGGFVIYRPKELTLLTLFGRIFTGATTKTSTYIYPPQQINRSGFAGSVLLQVPGGNLMIERPAKKVTINQDYGYKESWLDNWQLMADTFNGTDFEYWTQENGSIAHAISEIVNSEKDGVAIYGAGIDPNVYVYRFKQIIGANCIPSGTDFFTIEFDFAFYNATAAHIDNVTSCFAVKQNGNNLLPVTDDNINLVWGIPTYGVSKTWAGMLTGYQYGIETVSPMTVDVGFTGWISLKRQFIGIGAIPIELSFSFAYLDPSTGSADIYACYKNIKLYTTSTKTLEKQTKRKLIQRFLEHDPSHFFFGGYGPKYRTTIIREETGNIVEHTYNPVCTPTSGNDLDYDYLLGDVTSVSTPANKGDVNIENILEQFAGSLSAPQLRTDIIELTGSSGTCSVLVGGIGRVATWNALGLSNTAADFVTANAATWAGIGITLTSILHELYFVSTIKGADFFNYDLSDYLPGGSKVTNLTGTMNGIIRYYDLAISASVAWNTRGGSEDKPLLEIIGDEIALQYSRPKQLIQMPIKENGNSVSDITLIGNFQDSLLMYSGAARKFVFNRGEWSAKFRKWVIDLCEII